MRYSHSSPEPAEMSTFWSWSLLILLWGCISNHWRTKWLIGNWSLGSWMLFNSFLLNIINKNSLNCRVQRCEGNKHFSVLKHFQTAQLRSHSLIDTRISKPLLPLHSSCLQSYLDKQSPAPCVEGRPEGEHMLGSQSSSLGCAVVRVWDAEGGRDLDSPGEEAVCH